jgi:predicted kinase
MALVDNIPNPKDQNPKEPPTVLILVGLQGSGKSTLAQKLVPLGWERVNQDDLGTRKACEARMEQALKQNKRVVVDRCNLDVQQRKTWFNIAAKYNALNSVDCVVLNIPVEVCKKRVAERKDHPTLGPNENVFYHLYL